MKSIFISILLLQTAALPAQMFGEIGAGAVVPSMKPALVANAGMRWNDFELSAAATFHPNFSYNAGVVAWYRFASSHMVSDMQTGLLIGFGYGYTWHNQSAMKNGANNFYAPVISIKYTSATVFNYPIVPELRWQGKIPVACIAIRFQKRDSNTY